MAPMTQSCYFPPLDKCLDGRHQLLSWKSTFVGLSQLGDIPDDGCLKRHLQDPETIAFLSRPLSPYPKPTSQTKLSFETKTSAINISPLAQGRYDIKQLQEDSLWLSKETSIDEIAALRIVILEWQSQPAERLLQSDPYNEVPKLGQSISGTLLQASFSASRSSLSGKQSTVEEGPQSFDSPQSRRLRLLHTYLSERLYILKVSDYIASASISAFSLRAISQEREDTHANGSASPTWVEQLGNEILTTWNYDGVTQSNSKSFMVAAIDAVQSRIESLENECKWLYDEDFREFMGVTWERNQLLEAIQVMRLILTLLTASSKLARTDTFLTWFKFMDKYRFFDSLELPLKSSQDGFELPFQSLVALISLGLLNVPYALEMVLQNSTSAVSVADSGNDAPYLMNLDAINEAKIIFMDAADGCINNASLAVLGWSIIFQNVRDWVIALKEQRESRQNLRAPEKYHAGESSDLDGPGRSSVRRSPSIGSDTPQASSFLEEALDRILDTSLNEDAISYLAKSAVDGSRVLDVIVVLSIDFCSALGSDRTGKPGLRIRRMLLDLIQAVLEWIEYQPALLIAALAVLTGDERYWDTWKQPQGSEDWEPSIYFLTDQVLMQKIFRTAIARFPYETLPFLQFCRALAAPGTMDDEGQPIFLTLLQAMDSLTCVLPARFTNYEIVREDEDANYIQLTSNMNVFDCTNFSSSVSRMNHIGRLSPKDARSINLLELPRGTIGRVLSETKPLVVMWRYDYSVLNYMGRILQYALVDRVSISASAASVASREVVSEVIDLLTIMMSSVSTKNSRAENVSTQQNLVQGILESASDGLDRNQDVVSVIFEIFETELHRRQSTFDEQDPLDVLVRCIQFTHALLLVMPDRVWSFLGRSGFVGMNGVESQFATIIASVERVSGRYDFLLGCIRVYDALIDDAITSAVSRKSPTTTVKRFAVTERSRSRISQALMEKIILSFQRAVVDVFESMSNWKFASQEEKLEINTYICLVFSKILNYTFGVNDQTNISQKLTRPISSAAQYILDVFLPSSSSNISIHPLLQILLEGVAAPDSSLFAKILQQWTSQVVAGINLITTLIQVNSLLGRQFSSLEDQIFKATPILAKLYAAHEKYRLPIINLFNALVLCADSAERQPPSLLGHLGQYTASWFLEMLSTVDQPLSDNELSIGIWRFLSTVVSRRQQWIAIFVLTGNTPRKTLKDGERSDTKSVQRVESLFAVALEELSNLDKLMPINAIVMLEFIALAADYWPWALSVIGEHPHFLAAIRQFIEISEPRSTTPEEKFNKVSNDYLQLRIYSLVMDILAMYVHYTQQANNSSFATKLRPNLSYLSKIAVSAPSYNASLHGNLCRNLESKFPGCSLADFKRTAIRRNVLGPSFYYDFEMAERMLSFDAAWNGRRGQGFAEEMLRANINLSLVDSQVKFFQSWRFLAVEMGQYLGKDQEFQDIMIKTAIGCLRCNASNNLPEHFFEQLAMSRAQLAFTLLQQLIESSIQGAEIKDILSAAWDVIRRHETDVGLGLNGDGAAYYRLLLKIICLALRIEISSLHSKSHNSRSENGNVTDESPAASKTVRIALEILGIIVARGFCSLTTALHENPAHVVPADFSLIIAILRTSLHIPGITNHTTQLLTQFSDNQTVRFASALLSWSDQIATGYDPIYGELSISFLLELSSIPVLAEALAVEGILTQILSTNLIGLLRQEAGMGPFDNPVRLYSIWSCGLLPLFLNLLHAIGAPIAAEIASTLNNFPGQLTRASSTFGSKPLAASDPVAGSITLSMALEAQNLAIIVSILATFREAGASAGVIANQIVDPAWDKKQVKEDIELWMQRRAALRDRIVPTNAAEDAWIRLPPSSNTSGSENLLEEKVVQEMNTVFMILGGGEQ